MAEGRRFNIIGGGIGGLTAAIALRQSGFHAEVFERAEQLKEVGAGIGLSPNAIRVLKRLDLMEQVIRCGTIINAAVSYTNDGRMISSMPTNLSDVPTVCVHRADLQQILFSALPEDSVHLGEDFRSFQQAGGHIEAAFASGHIATGDALIGADGLRSKVRAQLIGNEQPTYRGYQCWRGVSDVSVPSTGLLTETFGRGVRFGLVPIGKRGTAWWCTANESVDATDQPGGAKAKVQQLVANWHPPITDVVNGTEPTAIIKTAVYDRRPVKCWANTACTLIGDAAHPMTPNMGQGGCMAIEDAIVLARCLSSDAQTAQALKRYERLRNARTTTITNVSRYYGVLGQWKNPVACSVRNLILGFSSRSGAAKGYLKFVSYDPYTAGIE
jgi:2-polyprenyl-6-methoxyphenol hydroxylase-like FAD-dependent oxidoreductase